jgi:hypothetical protein
MLDTFFKQPLPSSIWNLTGLQELSLDWGLTAESTCTEELGGLVELRVLNLRLDARSGSVGGARRPWSVIELPPSMGKLTGLEKLHLEVLSSAHQITPDFLLPEEIGEMEGLRELSLKSCGAKELPSSIQKLTGLEKLSLQCCRNIEALPQGMESMVGLRLLNLAGCRLGDAGASFIAKILRTNHSIRHLYLNKCGIQEDGILAIGRAIQETPRAPCLSQPFKFEIGEMEELRELSQPFKFNIDGIELNVVAAKLGLPVGSHFGTIKKVGLPAQPDKGDARDCSNSRFASDWCDFRIRESNSRITRWMFGDFVVLDSVIAFASALIAEDVEEQRPRRLDGPGNSVIPAVSVLGQDIIQHIVHLFISMRTQERMLGYPMMCHVDSETESEEEFRSDYGP